MLLCFEKVFLQVFMEYGCCEEESRHKEDNVQVHWRVNNIHFLWMYWPHPHNWTHRKHVLKNIHLYESIFLQPWIIAASSPWSSQRPWLLRSSSLQPAVGTTQPRTAGAGHRQHPSLQPGLHSLLRATLFLGTGGTNWKVHFIIPLKQSLQTFRTYDTIIYVATIKCTFYFLIHLFEDIWDCGKVWMQIILRSLLGKY